MKTRIPMTLAGLLTATLAVPALATDHLLTDFQSRKLSWRTVNDNVMGGRSQGGPAFTQSTLVFSGKTSLRNNGGFSSIRSGAADLALAGKDGIALRVKGDGRTYTMVLQSADPKRMRGVWVSYWQPFQTRKGVWQTVTLPLSGFYPTSYGQRLPFPRLRPERIRSLGFLIYDKKAGPFRLEVDRVSAYKGAPAEAKAQAKAPAKPVRKSLIATAQAAGSFKTLLAAAQAAGLVQTLQGGPYTVLAPTDAAFARLPKGTVKALLAPSARPQLRAILLHHVIAGKRTAGDLLSARRVVTASGQALEAGFERGEPRVGKAGLAATDIVCSNGVIHVIDRVLMPQTQSLAALAAGSKQLTTLVAAVKAAGLLETLAGPGPFTVLAPTDAAFASLGDTVKSLLEPRNKARLVAILKHHVISGRIDAAAALRAGKARTLAGESITIGLKDRRLQIAGAKVLAADLQARNGVVHLIDRVLIPKRLPTAAPAPVTVANADVIGQARKLLELSIERGVPLYNAGQPGACAAIYEVTVSALVALSPETFSGRTGLALRKALTTARGQRDARERAWTLRRAIDAAHAELEATM